MTKYQLGHAQEAQADLKKLQEQMKDSRWAYNSEAQGFQREAEVLLSMPQKLNAK
jgi:hypothetical protein